MFKAQLLVVDPAYDFSDHLTGDVKRGSADNYKTLTLDDIKNLDINSITADDSVLALWVPSSMLRDGLDLMEAWNFRQTQTVIWVKHKLNPLESLKKSIKSLGALSFDDIKNLLDKFNLNDVLSFYMGRIFRQTHEVCLIGVKGNVYKNVVNKSQRSVIFGHNDKHSSKPEALQDRLELIFPNFVNRVELFARRDRPGWLCFGNECPSTMGQDIRESINLLKLL